MTCKSSPKVRLNVKLLRLATGRSPFNYLKGALGRKKYDIENQLFGYCE